MPCLHKAASPFPLSICAGGDLAYLAANHPFRTSAWGLRSRILDVHSLASCHTSCLLFFIIGVLQPRQTLR